MNDNLEYKIRNVMSTVFELPVENFNKLSSPDNIASWDSLKHMNLVVALEEEFEIEFLEDEILDMMNFELIFTILSTKVSDK
jgi:acyl carrier protein